MTKSKTKTKPKPANRRRLYKVGAGYNSYRTGNYLVFLGRAKDGMLVFVRPANGEVYRISLASAQQCVLTSDMRDEHSADYGEWRDVNLELPIIF